MRKSEITTTYYSSGRKRRKEDDRREQRHQQETGEFRPRRTADIDEAIRRRAYELYEARGREDGRDLEDWFRAEAEMVQKKSSTSAPPEPIFHKRSEPRPSYGVFFDSCRA